MSNVITTNFEFGTLEYVDEVHQYFLDGLPLPSITQLLSVKFGNKYDGLPNEILAKAAKEGTNVHEAIERLIKLDEDSELPEVRNFKALQRFYGFEAKDSEIPIVLFRDGEAVAAGRLDLLLSEGGEYGIADIKHTCTFDKEYVTYQTNLYRIGFEQTYKTKISFLRGIHLRGEQIRKYYKLPINERLVNEYLDFYFKGE